MTDGLTKEEMDLVLAADRRPRSSFPEAMERFWKGFFGKGESLSPSAMDTLGDKAEMFGTVQANWSWVPIANAVEEMDNALKSTFKDPYNRSYSELDRIPTEKTYDPDPVTALSAMQAAGYAVGGLPARGMGLPPAGPLVVGAGERKIGQMMTQAGLKGRPYGMFRLKGAKPGTAKELVQGFKPGDTYLEPFLGSGAVLNEVLRQGKPFGKLIAGDINPDTAMLHKTIKQNPEGVSEAFNELLANRGISIPYKGKDVRKLWGVFHDLTKGVFRTPEEKTAAQLIIGNYARQYDPGYSPRQFIPGNYARAETISKRILEYGKRLQDADVDIDQRSWDATLAKASGKTTAYIDPPYMGTAGYKGGRFTAKDAKQLNEVLENIARTGGQVTLNEFRGAEKFYQNFEFEPTGRHKGREIKGVLGPSGSRKAPAKPFEANKVPEDSLDSLIGDVNTVLDRTSLERLRQAGWKFKPAQLDAAPDLGTRPNPMWRMIEPTPGRRRPVILQPPAKAFEASKVDPNVPAFLTGETPVRGVESVPVNPLDEIPSKAVSSVPVGDIIETEFSLDKTNMLPTLLRDIANQNPARTMVYELMQNSLDALGATGKPGKIDVFLRKNAPGETAYDPEGHMFRFVDTGKGMTPQEVQEFLVVAGSIGKSGVETRGGYGLAKVPLLLMPEEVKVTTVSQGVKSTLTTNPKEIMSGKIKIHTEKTSEPSGTTFEARLPSKVMDREISQWTMQRSLEEVASRTWTETPIELFLENSFWDPNSSFDYRKERYSSYYNYGANPLNEQETRFDPDYVALDDSYAKINYIKTEPYGSNWAGKYELDKIVTNKGLGVDISGSDIRTPKLVNKPDFKVVIDFERTPTVRDPKYPFLKNRTELTEEFEERFSKLITDKIRDMAHKQLKLKAEEFKATLERAPEYSGVKIIIPQKPGQGFHRISGKLQDNQDLIKAYASVVDDFKDMLEAVGESAVDFHLTTDPEVYGFKSNKKVVGEEIYAINPFVMTKKFIQNTSYKKAVEAGADPNRVKADTMVHTLIHEFTHKTVGGHSENFSSEMARLYTNLGHENTYLLTMAMEDFYNAYGTRIEGLEKDFRSLAKSGEGFQDGTDFRPVRGQPLGSSQAVSGMERGTGDFLDQLLDSKTFK